MRGWFRCVHNIDGLMNRNWDDVFVCLGNEQIYKFWIDVKLYMFWAGVGGV